MSAACQAASPHTDSWWDLQGAPKLKVAIVGSGLAGLSTAAELLDQGHEVDIYESRPFLGGKVASFKDRSGNHIEVNLPNLLNPIPATGALVHRTVGHCWWQGMKPCSQTLR